MYRCRANGKRYYAFGWWGSTWNKFGLEQAYWLMKTIDPKLRAIRGSELEAIEERYFRRGKEFEPFIESHKDERFDYFMQSEVEACLKPCPGCGGPLFQIDSLVKPHHWCSLQWYSYGQRFGLSDKQTEKLIDRSPMWARFNRGACSDYCRNILEKRAGFMIYERVESWAKQHHEEERIKKLRSLHNLARTVLKSGKPGALKRLKTEYEQVATSLI